MTTERGERRLTGESALRWGLIWLGIVLAVLLAWQLRQVLVLAFLAVLFAAGLYRLTSPLERRGVPRIAAVLVVYLALLAVVALLIWIVVPPLIEQLVELVENLPTFIGGAESWLRQQMDALPGDIGDEGFGQLQEQMGGVIPDLSALAAVPIVVVSLLVNLVLVVFLSAMLLLERDRLWDGMLAYLRPKRRNQATEVAQSAADKLGAFVRGQLLMMTIIGIGTAIGMFVLGVPFVLPLSFLAFLTEAIPIVGPFISGIPIILIAFTEDLWTGIFMTAWIVGLQQLEGLVLAPIIQNKALKLSPVVILLGVVAGGTLAGVIGALIAIPLVAVAQVILSEVVLPLRRESWGEAEG